MKKMCLLTLFPGDLRFFQLIDVIKRLTLWFLKPDGCRKKMSVKNSVLIQNLHNFWRFPSKFKKYLNRLCIYMLYFWTVINISICLSYFLSLFVINIKNKNPKPSKCSKVFCIGHQISNRESANLKIVLN